MNDPIPPFPAHLSDEAAFALSEALHWLALFCDKHYFAQIRRHMQTLQPRPTNPQRPWER